MCSHFWPLQTHDRQIFVLELSSLKFTLKSSISVKLLLFNLLSFLTFQRSDITVQSKISLLISLIFCLKGQAREVRNEKDLLVHTSDGHNSTAQARSKLDASSKFPTWIKDQSIWFILCPFFAPKHISMALDHKGSTRDSNQSHTGNWCQVVATYFMYHRHYQQFVFEQEATRDNY